MWGDSDAHHLIIHAVLNANWVVPKLTGLASLPPFINYFRFFLSSIFVHFTPYSKVVMWIYLVFPFLFLTPHTKLFSWLMKTAKFTRRAPNTAEVDHGSGIISASRKYFVFGLCSNAPGEHSLWWNVFSNIGLFLHSHEDNSINRDY